MQHEDAGGHPDGVHGGLADRAGRGRVHQGVAAAHPGASRAGDAAERHPSGEHACLGADGSCDLPGRAGVLHAAAGAG